ncbi:MAG: hypothetical protein WA113_07735, partial [Desulfitobacteriaceae bacterium]
RQKISYEPFKILFDTTTQLARSEVGMDTFKGLHVSAIDGTTLVLENMPELVDQCRQFKFQIIYNTDFLFIKNRFFLGILRSNCLCFLQELFPESCKLYFPVINRKIQELQTFVN